MNTKSILLYTRAVTYAEDVVSGKEVTTWEVKKQCSYFLQDIHNQEEEEFLYYIDFKKLKIINDLLKLFNYATGFVAGKQVLDNLVGFQCFFLCNLFGWRFKDNPKKFRYNDITLFIARKNAKTNLVAIIFILLMLTEQKYSEFYSICLTKELAAEIRKAMVQLLEASPLIAKYFFWSETLTGVIQCKLTKSFFNPRTAQAGKNNAVRPSAFVLDEAGNFTENSNFNAMKSGQKNVINPLVFRTTTAYAIDNSIMEEDLKYIRNVFNGSIDNQRQFAMLYYAEKENLWNDTGILQANPLRIEENYNIIREDREVALYKESQVEEYLTKAMNHFVPSKSSESFIDQEQIKKCELKEDINWKGREVYIGVDLAETDDNTAVAMLTYDSYADTIYCKSWAFIPTNRISIKSKKEKVDYLKEINMGNCFSCGDEVIDYGFVENFILNLENTYGVSIIQVGYDRRNALSSAQKLENNGIETVEVLQHSKVLHSPIKMLKEYILNGKFKYKTNKLLNINFANCKLTKDTNLNKYINKKVSKGKIDLVFAIIDALYLQEQELLDSQSGWTIQK